MELATMILSAIAALSGVISISFSIKISREKSELHEVIEKNIELTRTLKTDIKEVRETKTITATQDYAAMINPMVEKMSAAEIMKLLEMANKDKK
ncbi:MAG: hypothetical protein KQ78_00828 [Candidatus Izimaplasma bacterium HR2]|nr:MAG: hypothetical protein KQ78_00828 [Candidatus Izimaplasma bacterium HR2]